jgi:DNA polymerase/3'-5' exonuclease PolX
MSLILPNQLKLHRWVTRFLVWRLAKQLGIKDYVISGSYRRGKWWSNDIDLVVPVQSEEQAEGLKARMEQLGWAIRKSRRMGGDKFSVQYIKQYNGKIIILDLFLSYPGHMGNTLLFTTGPKSFNEKIRYDILDMGYSWQNPRYFNRFKGNKNISFDTEEGAMNFLGIGYVKPSKRI